MNTKVSNSYHLIPVLLLIGTVSLIFSSLRISNTSFAKNSKNAASKLQHSYVGVASSMKSAGNSSANGQYSNSSKQNPHHEIIRNGSSTIINEDEIPSQNSLVGSSNENKNKEEEEEEDNNGREKPIFVFHIGPPKTATTTIQCGLQQLASELAIKDSYFYVGKVCPRHSEIFGNNETAIRGHYMVYEINYLKDNGYVTSALKARMDWHHSLGNNMIFSIEKFAVSLEDNDTIWDILDNLFHKWNVHIIITYRHYFDWIPSLYYQTYIQYNQWNQRRPSFRNFLTTKLLEEWNLNSHPTISSFRKYSKHFNNVHLFNLHQHHDQHQGDGDDDDDDDDVLTNFVCQMIPTATNVCERLRGENGLQVVHSTSTTTNNNNNMSATMEEVDYVPTKKKERRVERKSSSFDPYRIAEALYQQGLLGKNPSRSKDTVAILISQHLKQQQSTTNLTKFMDCLPQRDLDILLNASLSFESELRHSKPEDFLPVVPRGASDADTNSVSSALASSWKLEHMKLFTKAVSQGKFCEINPELLIADTEWSTFLSGLS